MDKWPGIRYEVSYTTSYDPTNEIIENDYLTEGEAVKVCRDRLEDEPAINAIKVTAKETIFVLER